MQKSAASNSLTIIPQTAKRILEEKQAKRAPAETVIQQATSPAEELKKMKELLDMDIITQEEFDAKKKQLLGL